MHEIEAAFYGSYRVFVECLLITEVEVYHYDDGSEAECEFQKIDLHFPCLEILHYSAPPDTIIHYVHYTTINRKCQRIFYDLWSVYRALADFTVFVPY